MKTAKHATWSMRIAAVSAGAAFFFGVSAGVLPTFATAYAEDAEVAKMTLEEVDAWDTDGYKIEKKSGVYNDGTADIAYDYEITISDEIWFVGGSLSINNVASRPFKLNISTSEGIPVTGNEFFSQHKSWLNKCTSTNPAIAELSRESWKAGRENNLYLEAKQEVGKTVLTFPLNITVSEDDLPGFESLGYTAGQTINETLSILYNCVKKENTMFTFTGAAKDLNDNANSVWLYGVNIPEANEEWTKAEVAGTLMDKFYSNIYYLEGNEDGTPKELTEANLTGNDFKTILTNRASGAMKMQIEVRDNHMEIKKLVRQYDNDDDGTAVSFEEGDALYLKQGLYYLGKDGNTNWCLYERGFSFFELSRAQHFIFRGEAARLVGRRTRLQYQF